MDVAISQFNAIKQNLLIDDPNMDDRTINKTAIAIFKIKDCLRYMNPIRLNGPENWKIFLAIVNSVYVDLNSERYARNLLRYIGMHADMHR